MILAKYRAQVDLLLSILPHVAKENNLALKGGTAINLFVRDMPRLSVDIDLTYLNWEDDRATALQNISDALGRIEERIKAAIPDISVTRVPEGQGQDVKLNCQTKQAHVKIEVNTTTRGIIFPVRMMQMKEERNANISDPQFSSDVKQLENMMEMMNSGEQADPEMQQISGMLEKILDIQHPDRVREKIKEQSEQKKDQVFPVETLYGEENISLINPARGVNQIVTDSTALLGKIFSVKVQQNSFFDLDDEAEGDGVSGNAIEAVIHDTQELVAGSTVKMRLMTDVYINGKLISKDQFIYGTTAINGERLTIEINSIRDNNSLFPVSLSAYDMDGIEGIYIPGAITRDAAKQSSDQAMQSMQLLSMDQSIGAQAASAGLQAAKGLFSKKVKLIKVTVKAGYRILLKDQQ